MTKILSIFCTVLALACPSIVQASPALAVNTMVSQPAESAGPLLAQMQSQPTVSRRSGAFQGGIPRLRVTPGNPTAARSPRHDRRSIYHHRWRDSRAADAGR
jgi:hypothetical protein